MHSTVFGQREGGREAEREREREGEKQRERETGRERERVRGGGERETDRQRQKVTDREINTTFSCSTNQAKPSGPKKTTATNSNIFYA